MDSSLGYAGVGLNIPERTKLEILMAKTQTEEKLSEINFWGKIYGTEADYLICCGTKKAFTSVPVKTFYVCVGDGLRALPNLQNESFTGSLDTSVDVESGEEDGEAVTELHRLSAKVNEIDFDVSVVPHNAYFVDSSHQVRKNKTFQGLNFSLASSLSSYYHFRDPVKMNRKSILEKRALIPSTQFLDPLSEDSPKGIWRLQFSADKTTSKYSGAYFGDGKKNGSLPFMI
eukprot:g1903.t1